MRLRSLHARLVVGAAVDADDCIVPASARGEHEHRCGAAGVPPPAQQGEPVDRRQPEIEEDSVVPLGGAQVVGTRAVACCVHRIARRGQRRGELRRKGRFVFDYQDSHALPNSFLIAQVDLNAS